MRDYNETELNNKIDAFLARKLSVRFGSSLRFKADYLDRTKATVAMLLPRTRKSERVAGLASLKKDRFRGLVSSRYLTI